MRKFSSSCHNYSFLVHSRSKNSRYFRNVFDVPITLATAFWIFSLMGKFVVYLGLKNTILRYRIELFEFIKIFYVDILSYIRRERWLIFVVFPKRSYSSSWGEKLKKNEFNSFEINSLFRTLARTLSSSIEMAHQFPFFYNFHLFLKQEDASKWSTCFQTRFTRINKISSSVKANLEWISYKTERSEVVLLKSHFKLENFVGIFENVKWKSNNNQWFW